MDILFFLDSRKPASKADVCAAIEISEVRDLCNQTPTGVVNGRRTIIFSADNLVTGNVATAKSANDTQWGITVREATHIQPSTKTKMDNVVLGAIDSLPYCGGAR